MEDKRTYFLKDNLLKKLYGVIIIVLSIFTGIPVFLSLSFQTKPGWFVTYISFYAVMISVAIKYMRKNIGYTTDEGIFFNDKKVRWSDVVSVFFNSRKYLIKSKTGESLEIEGDFYLLHEELDKRFDKVPNKGLLSSPIRRWTAKGKKYFSTDIEDNITGIVDKFGSVKIPGYIVIIIVVVFMFLLFTINIWPNKIFGVNLVK